MQQRYSDPMLAGRQGLPYSSSGSSDTVTMLNNSASTAQVSTITIDSASNSTTYTQYINGVTVTYTTDSSTSTTEAATALALAITNEPLLNGDMTATSAAAVVTLTARNAGTAFTITAAAHFTAADTTANAAASSVPFGVLVVRDGTDSKLARKVVAAALAFQVDVLTPTAVNDVDSSVSVKLANGQTYAFHYTADGSATVQEAVEAIAAGLNNILPASTVAATEDNSTLILTSEVAGVCFESGFTSVTTQVWALTSSTRLSNFATDINKAAVGVTLESLAYERTSTGTIGYPANSAMSVMRKGQVWVQTQVSTVDPTDPVYVGTTASTTQGLWTNTPTAGYVLLDPAKFSWDGYTGQIISNSGTSVNGAVLRVNL